MSQGDDEMVFGDVSFREPMRLRRPDRDRRRTTIAYETPGPGDLPIFLDRRPADAIERHALRDTTVELGGILLGKECVDDETGEPFVLITEALEARHYENTQASFTYTHDSWEEITREREARFPDLDIVGWYHTHPDFGVFLSSHDLFIHHHFFAQALQVAYVVDPIRQTRGFFHWRDGQMAAVRGFFVTADRGDRSALARFVNDLENLPNPEGAGSGLSPRLEAELIAMLSRPPAHAVTAVDRTQSAAVFTLLGLALGGLIVGLLAWLASLAGTLREQSEALAAVARAQSELTARRSDDAPAARISAKEQALNTLLGQIQLGVPPEVNAANLLGAAERSAELEQRIARVETEKTGLLALNDTLKQQADQAQLRIDQAGAEAAAEKAAAQKALDELATLKGKLGDAERGLAIGPMGPVHWAALGGWLAFALTAAALLANLNRRADVGTLGPESGPLDGPSVTVANPAAGPRPPGDPDRPQPYG